MSSIKECKSFMIKDKVNYNHYSYFLCHIVATCEREKFEVDTVINVPLPLLGPCKGGLSIPDRNCSADDIRE